MKSASSAVPRLHGLFLVVSAILLGAPNAATGNLSTSGSVTNDLGDPWTMGAPLHVGHSGFGSFLIDDHIDGNGLTSMTSSNLWIGWDDGSQGSFTVRGSGTSHVPGNLYIAEGVNARGTFTQAGGAVRVDPDYKNYYIYLGRGAGSEGTMILTDSGTRLRLADWLLVGHMDGSRGELRVESGAVCDSSRLFVGYQANAVGQAFVSGAGSILKTWRNEATGIGWSGRGSLTIHDGGLAQLRDLQVGYANGAYGEVLVTGAGSRLEALNSPPNIGRGGGSQPGPGEGLVRLARGGVLDCSSGLEVGTSSYDPKGTMVFTIGDHGGGTIGPGRADVNGQLGIRIATLLMEVDPGISLPLGQQFVLIDYLSLHYANNRFQNLVEGGVVVTANHHAFRINYATDLGGGDLAITATVVPAPTTDSDSDHLIDAWETRCFGAIDDPRAIPEADPDGDGRNNADEHEAGTDPLDPTSCCASALVATASGIPFDLTYSPYEPDLTYTIEFSTDPAGPWSEITPNAIAVNGDTIVFTLPPETAEKAFYHVKFER